MRIITDSKEKLFKYAYEVPKSVLADYDHLDESEQMDGFIQYRNRWYHLSDFMFSTVEGWDGVCGDSYFSGVLIKIPKYKTETYIIGRYIC